MSFGNLDLRHYDSKPFKLDRSRRYQHPELADELGRDAFAAPNGKPRGLWVSIKGEDDWPSWCEAEDFYLEEIATEHRVRLQPDANVLVIRGEKEFDAFHAEYEVDIYNGRIPARGKDRTTFSGRPIPDWNHDHIDWGRVAERYDGIIIAPYLWDRRLTGPSWYYGWDVASGCIWNLRAIKEFRPSMIPELEELSRRMERWIDVAAEQAINRIKYGVSDPHGGKGRQQYPINHPLFPEA